MKVVTYITSIKEDTKHSFQFYQSLRFGIIILSSIFLVKLGMSQKEVSAFEWVFFLSNALSFFWSSGMLNGLLTYAPKLESKMRGTFIKSIMIFFLVSSLLSASLLILGNYLNFYRIDEQLGAIALYLIFNVSSSIIVIIYVLRDQSLNIFYYGIISYILYIVLIVGSYYYFGKNYHAAILGLLLWSCLRFLFFLYNIIKEKSNVNLNILIPFIIFALPLMIKVFVGQGMIYIDGFLVNHYFPEEFFAIYRYGARELPINTILITALLTSSLPGAVRNLRGTLNETKNRITRLMHWLFPLSIILIFVSDYLFRFFYSEEYQLSADIFKVYLLILVTRILLPQLSFYALHKNKLMLIISIIETIVNIVLSIYFIQVFGLIGIVYATLIAYILEKVLLILISRVKFQIRMNQYIDVPIYLIYTSLLIIAYIVQNIYY